jgi:hypothetical protein
MLRLRAAIGVAAAVLLLAGCASTTTGTAPASPAASGNPAAFDERARAVVKVWTDAGMPRKWRIGFVPLQDLTVIAADPGFDSASKQAFLTGAYQMAAPLLLPPPPGVIRFPDGSSMRLTLQTEEDAFAALNTGHCPDSDCRPLKVTDVTLTPIKFLTSRGLASVPAWSFTVEGLNSPIYRIAVPPAAISKVPAPAADWPNVPDLRGAQDLIRIEGETITFRLGVGACDKKIRPYVYETHDVIAVGGTAHASAGVCESILKLQPETVTLKRPVGTRAILDAVGGQPLLVSAYR